MIETQARMVRALTDLAGRHRDQLVAMVSHGAAIRMWVAARASNIDVGFASEHALNNTGIVIVEGSPADGWKALTWEGKTVELPDDLNGEFTIQSTQNGMQITITGSRTAKEKTVKSITIKEGDVSVELDSIDKLPEKYRETVQKLLKNVK